MEPGIQQFLMNLPELKQEICFRVRDLFLSSDSTITEKIKWNQLTFSAGKQNIAFIYTFPGVNYMNLGFFKATQLEDPKKLFEGTGKGMRHIKLYNPETIPEEQILQWVREAIVNC